MSVYDDDVENISEKWTCTTDDAQARGSPCGRHHAAAAETNDDASPLERVSVYTPCIHTHKTCILYVYA